MNYGITFLSMLDSETINEKNCALRDEEGKRISCSLKYDEKTKSIKILPEELCKENTNYYLILSDRVKTATGESMGSNCQIRFKISGRDVYELLTLRGKQCRNFSEQQEKKPEVTTAPVEYLRPLPVETEKRPNKTLDYKVKFIFVIGCVVVFAGVVRFLL